MQTEYVCRQTHPSVIGSCSFFLAFSGANLPERLRKNFLRSFQVVFCFLLSVFRQVLNIAPQSAKIKSHLCLHGTHSPRNFAFLIPLFAGNRLICRGKSFFLCFFSWAVCRTSPDVSATVRYCLQLRSGTQFFARLRFRREVSASADSSFGVRPGAGFFFFLSVPVQNRAFRKCGDNPPRSDSPRSFTALPER